MRGEVDEAGLFPEHRGTEEREDEQVRESLRRENERSGSTGRDAMLWMLCNSGEV